jgi:hypothetical protein
MRQLFCCCAPWSGEEEGYTLSDPDMGAREQARPRRHITRQIFCATMGARDVQQPRGKLLEIPVNSGYNFIFYELNKSFTGPSY